MTKFGKRLHSSKNPRFGDSYIAYKAMKRILKDKATEAAQERSASAFSSTTTQAVTIIGAQLLSDLRKVSTHVDEQCVQLRRAALRHASADAQENSEDEWRERLVELEQYVALNHEAVAKILKKLFKKCGIQPCSLETIFPDVAAVMKRQEHKLEATRAPSSTTRSVASSSGDSASSESSSGAGFAGMEMVSQQQQQQQQPPASTAERPTRYHWSSLSLLRVYRLCRAVMPPPTSAVPDLEAPDPLSEQSVQYRDALADSLASQADAEELADAEPEEAPPAGAAPADGERDVALPVDSPLSIVGCLAGVVSVAALHYSAPVDVGWIFVLLVAMCACRRGACNDSAFRRRACDAALHS